MHAGEALKPDHIRRQHLLSGASFGGDRLILNQREDALLWSCSAVFTHMAEGGWGVHKRRDPPLLPASPRRPSRLTALDKQIAACCLSSTHLQAREKKRRGKKERQKNKESGWDSLSLQGLSCCFLPKSSLITTDSHFDWLPGRAC